MPEDIESPQNHGEKSKVFSTNYHKTNSSTKYCQMRVRNVREILGSLLRSSQNTITSVTQHPTFSWTQSLTLQGEGNKKKACTNKPTNESSSIARTTNRSHVVQMKGKEHLPGSCELHWKS